METRVRKITFKGKDYIDIRKFYQPKGSSDWRPTKKGIAIPPAELSTVITALEKEEALLQGALV